LLGLGAVGDAPLSLGGSLAGRGRVPDALLGQLCGVLDSIDVGGERVPGEVGVAVTHPRGHFETVEKQPGGVFEFDRLAHRHLHDPRQGLLAVLEGVLLDLYRLADELVVLTHARSAGGGADDAAAGPVGAPRHRV
jgi:hypothetical protein